MNDTQETSRQHSGAVVTTLEEAIEILRGLQERYPEGVIHMNFAVTGEYVPPPFVDSLGWSSAKLKP